MVRTWSAAFAAALFMCATVAQAQTSSELTWSSAPSGDLVSELSPRFANMLGIGGTARIECRVSADGHPFVCRTISETHHGLGFGAAGRLIVASGVIRAERQNGRPISGLFRTNVNFIAPNFEDWPSRWRGPTPSATAMALAGRIVSSSKINDFPLDDQLDGLDFDRRSIVQEWMNELMPVTAAERHNAQTLQLARLFSEKDLQRILDGENVDLPSADRLAEACPELTERQIKAWREIRVRYCTRYEC